MKLRNSQLTCWFDGVSFNGGKIYIYKVKSSKTFYWDEVWLSLLKDGHTGLVDWNQGSSLRQWFASLGAREGV